MKFIWVEVMLEAPPPQIDSDESGILLHQGTVVHPIKLKCLYKLGDAKDYFFFAVQYVRIFCLRHMISRWSVKLCNTFL